MFDDVMHSTDILDDFDFDENVRPGFAEEGEVVAKFFSLMEAGKINIRKKSRGNI